MDEILEEYEKIKSCHLEYRKKYFEDMNINKVVFKAASSLDENNKIFPHQKRVGKKLAELGAFELVKFEDLILKATTFEDIFYYTELVRIDVVGLGNL